MTGSSRGKSKPRPAPKRRDREESTQRILKAGIEVFSELGYDAATTKKVADRAGLNESLLHRYFESKAGLLLAIIQSFIESEDCEAPYPEGETLEQEIFHFLRSRFENSEVKQTFLKIVISRMLVDPKIAEIARKRAGACSAQVLKDRLLRFQQLGQVRADLKIEDMVEMISAQGFSVGFIGHVLFNRTRKESLRQLQIFAGTFARGAVGAGKR